MDQVTQQNAAMVEQSTAASHSLNQEANELTRSVMRFRLGGDGAAVKKPAAASRNANPVATAQRRIASFAEHKSGNQNRASGRGQSVKTALKPRQQEDDWQEF
jgi:methyl-accepting chemotaxis protein